MNKPHIRCYAMDPKGGIVWAVFARRTSVHPFWIGRGIMGCAHAPVFHQFKRQA